MVTAVTSSTPKHRPSRPPLLPSGSDNAPPRRPKARQVTSRYLSLSTSSSSSSNSSSSTNTTSSSITSGSSISSRRTQSPLPSTRPATPKSQQRAVSAERRRPATPSSAERTLVTSARSLSVSFQGDSYSLPANLRKSSPVRRKAGVTPERDPSERNRENSRPSDLQQHRWPGRLRGGEDSSILSRSLDYGSVRVKCSGSGAALMELRKFVVDGNSRNKPGSRLKLETDEIEVPVSSELESRPVLDVESVPSNGNATELRGERREVVVPTKIWQDPSNRVHRVPTGAPNRIIVPSKLVPSPRDVGASRVSPRRGGVTCSTGALSRSMDFAKRFQNDSTVSSPREVSMSRGLSPLRGGVRAASPCKALNSSTSALLRGMASPSRVTSGSGYSTNDNNTCSTPSTLRFAVEYSRRGKLGDNQMADAHVLRLVYNRLLQWRLANAKVENTLLGQKHTAERNLYNAWLTTSKLRHSVNSKGVELQSLRQTLKLYSILKEQEPHLESWSLFDSDHCNSVSGAIKALEASTVRLPVVGGARADIHKVQEAISSAVDVMQAMASSVCFLLAKVEHMTLLVSELSKLSALENCLLDECKDLLSTTLIPLQVTHCSLRTQLLQVQHLPKSSTKKQ